MEKEELEALKQEAKELGIEFSAQIGAVKLQAKIDDFYNASEKAASKELEEAIAVTTSKEELAESTPIVGRKVNSSMAAIAREIYEQAKQTKIVTIIDNDQRVNNQTTMCKANWTNAYYDMGTHQFPLNTPVEIAQGFIDVLKEVRIPHHVKDPRTNLSTMVIRNRYSITVEDIAK